jgi:F0F1-type ATP synthase epsilon subunit
MQFSLATPEDNKKVLSNATKVKIHLTTGIVEILDKHQDLLGKIGIDLLEVEKNEDSKVV